MSYLEKQLLPDERVVHIATLHWIIFVPGMFMTALAAVIGFWGPELVGQSPLSSGTIGLLTTKLVTGAAFVAALLGLGLLVGSIVRQSSTELAITNRRLIAKYGFISRSTFEIMINRVTGVNFDQTIMGRVFGYGTILVHGAGGDISPFDVVANPQLFQRALMDVVEHQHH